MARFEEWLSNQEWKPKVITLCRSAISGYLPSDYSQYVEEQLLECLERIYSIKKEIREIPVNMKREPLPLLAPQDRDSRSEYSERSTPHRGT